MTQDDAIRGLSDSPFFHGLSEEERLSLVREGAIGYHTEGEVLFRPKQSPNLLYLVLGGIVEICRQESPDRALEPVAYLGPGATIGESKVISGSPLGALARFPEGGITLSWPRSAVLRRLSTSREFSLQYLGNLARRLEQAFASFGSGGAKLGGQLDHFDLPTILQTVVESGVSGRLEVVDARGNVFGSIDIVERAVGAISCGPLSGEDAFIEVTVAPPRNGRFAFAPAAEAPADGPRYNLQHLLLETMRLNDEFRRFSGEVPQDVPLRRAARQLTWTGDGDAELMERVWNDLGAQPRGWRELSRRLSCSRPRLAMAVRDMMEAGLIAADREEILHQQLERL